MNGIHIRLAGEPHGDAKAASPGHAVGSSSDERGCGAGPRPSGDDVHKGRVWAPCCSARSGALEKRSRRAGAGGPRLMS